MATASLPFVEVINHPTSHSASVDSILSECGQYPVSRDKPGKQTGTGQTTGGPQPTSTIGVTGSPTRRSASLVRRHRHLNKAVNEQSTQGGCPQRRSHCASGHAESVDQTRVSNSITESGRSAESRKSSTLTSTNVNKESGGRKILNFLQRGFIPRRPKSITKLDNRKLPSDIHHGSFESLSQTGSMVASTVIDPTVALHLLNEQIALPSVLINAFHLDSIGWSFGEADRFPRYQQIRPIDASLIGPEWRYCFQVVSHDTSTLVAQSPTNSSTGTILDVPPPSQQTVCSKETVLDVEFCPGAELSCTSGKRPNTVRTYACPSAIERSRWMLYLRRLVHPGLDTERRRENCLHIWIQEAKGLTDKHRYHCEILLDGVTYARTTSKRLTDMLFWGEEFDLSGSPEFDTMTVELWQDSNRNASDSVSTHRPHTASPPPPRTANSAPSPHTRRTTHSGTNTTFTTVQSPMPTRRTTMMMSCARGSSELLGPDDTQMGDEDTTGTVGEGTQNNAPVTSHVLRERTNNVLAGHKPAGPNKSAPVRRRAARRGKLKPHKHCTEAQLVAIVSLPASKLHGLSEVESWYPATVYDPLSRHKRSGASGDTQTTGKSRSQRTITNAAAQSNDATPSSPIQLRIKTRHRSVTVLPLTSYASLQSHLSRFQSSPIHPIPSSTINGSGDQADAALLLSSLDPWLGVKAKAELAASVVALQQAMGQAPQFLVVLILHEVSKQADPNMVLRGNSIATKATEIYLRLVGETYLSRVLADFVHCVVTGAVNGGAVEPAQIVKTAKQARFTPGSGFADCEVDTSKLQSSSQLTQNQSNLISLVETVWNRIVASEAYFPDKLRTIFATVRTHLDAAYPPLPPTTSKSSGAPQATLSEHVISACLFLRYICPAILSPSLFGLTPEFPSEPRVLRAFTLVAKTIQSLANFSLFAGSKEVYMTFMNPFVSTQLPAMRRFLYAISSPRTNVPRPIPLNDPSTSVSYSSAYFDGAAASLTQSICLPSGVNGTKRTALLTSHSHHGAFLGDVSTSDPDSLSDPSLLTRSISGLPAGSESESFVTSRPKGTNSNVPGNQWVHMSHFQSVASPQSPILLPPLPGTESNSQPGDHVDLALCLALCHLQLSEAVQKIPPEKLPPHVAKVKPVLEEIDFFLTSGVEPGPNWWYNDLNSNVASLQQCNPVQPIPSGNSIDPYSTPVSAPAVGSVHLDRSQMDLADSTNTSPVCLASDSPTVVHTSSGRHKILSCDRNTISNGENRMIPAQNQSNVVNGLAPRVCARPFVLPRSPSQKTFCPFVGNASVESHVVRSRSGSELMRGGGIGGGGTGPYLSNHHPLSPSKLDSPAPSPEVQLRSPVHLPLFPNGYTESYEQMPVPPPYSMSDSGSRIYSQPVDVPANRGQNAPLENRILPWSMDTDPQMIATLTDDSVAPIGLESSQSLPSTQSRGRPTPAPVDHPPSLVHTYHTTHSTSSGYQSLRSHDMNATANLGPAYGPNCYEYHQVASVKDHRRPLLHSGSMATCTSSAAVAMNNPLYEFHEPHHLSSVEAPDENGFTAPSDADNDDPRTPPAQATPMRAKSTAPPRSVRRHTYVNLANDPDTEAMFASLRTTGHPRRASITSDLDGFGVQSPVSRAGSPNATPSTQRYPTRVSCDLEAPLTSTTTGGSLTTLASDPNACAPPQPLRAHSSHRPALANSDLTRQVTTMHAAVEGFDLRLPSNGSGGGSVASRRCSMGKRVAVFQTEPQSLDPTSIRDELDASQARLAEAQARLLANEAERIQLLRAWHNELMKQSQLVTYGTRNVGQVAPVTATSSHADSESLPTPRTSCPDPSDSVRRRDANPLSTDPRDQHPHFDVSIPPNPTFSLTRASSRPLYGARPRMGASVIGAGYHEAHGSCTGLPSESGQTTIARGRPTFDRASINNNHTSVVSTESKPPRDAEDPAVSGPSPSTSRLLSHPIVSSSNQQSQTASSWDNANPSRETISSD